MVQCAQSGATGNADTRSRSRAQRLSPGGVGPVSTMKAWPFPSVWTCSSRPWPARPGSIVSEPPDTSVVQPWAAVTGPSGRWSKSSVTIVPCRGAAVAAPDVASVPSPAASSAATSRTDLITGTVSQRSARTSGRFHLFSRSPFPDPGRRRFRPAIPLSGESRRFRKCPWPRRELCHFSGRARPTPRAMGVGIPEQSARSPPRTATEPPGGRPCPNRTSLVRPVRARDPHRSPRPSGP